VGELRDHGAALNRALNEALRIHGGPVWRVFQVRHCCPFSSTSSSSCLFLAARRLLVLTCWRQELEHRTRDKYGAFDQMSAELRHLWEQRDAFDVLADALGTPDGWLSYGAEALRDQPLEYERQAAARPPPSSGFAQPSLIGMRRCSRCGGIWRRCARRRPTGG
jgi:hypothetical protein